MRSNWPQIGHISDPVHLRERWVRTPGNPTASNAARNVQPSIRKEGFDRRIRHPLGDGRTTSRDRAGLTIEF